MTYADAKDWTVEVLERSAAPVRKKEADGRGRKPDPGFVKGIRRLGKLLEDKERWFGELDEVEDLDGEDAKALWEAVTVMKLQCEELQKALVEQFGCAQVPRVGVGPAPA